MNQNDYSNREIDMMFNDVHGRFDASDKKLDAILAQTIKTNGRVSSLERWRAYILGGVSVLTVVVIPVLGYLAYQVIQTTQQVSAMTVNNK